MSAKPKKPKEFAMREQIRARLRKPLDQYALDFMDQMLGEFWSDDAKAKAKNKRYDTNALVDRADRERNELIKGGMKAPDADKKLYRKYKKPSPGAFNKWLYRNRKKAFLYRF
jgi:hypothetical protein